MQIVLDSKTDDVYIGKEVFLSVETDSSSDTVLVSNEAALSSRLLQQPGRAGQLFTSKRCLQGDIFINT